MVEEGKEEDDEDPPPLSLSSNYLACFALMLRVEVPAQRAAEAALEWEGGEILRTRRCLPLAGCALVLEFWV